jgi:hypothetical protein
MRRLIAIALLALGLAPAGCGSSAPSLKAFKSGFTTNKASFRLLGLDLQRAIGTAQTKTNAQLATELSALAKRADAQASALAKLNPPSRYQSDLRKLESAFRAVGADLSRMTTAATQRDAAGARAGTEALLQDAAKVKTSDDAISSGLHLPAG